MKRIGLVLLAGLVIAGCSDDKKDENWQVGYSFGYNIGERLRTDMADLNLDGFVAGLKDAYSNDEKARKMTAEEMQASLQAYQQKRIEKMREEMTAKSSKNTAEGDAFLAQNGKRAGVVTTASGLQYEVITKGSGPSPKATDMAKVLYHGTLIDGTVFDSTRNRNNEPAELPLSNVIPGWSEGLQLMNKGAKYKLYIPSKLAYGDRGVSKEVGPNATLIFEVELLDFNPQ